MSLRRTLIVVAIAVALTSLSACRKTQAPTQKPVAVYVNPDMTLEGYAEPGQKLEWHVYNAQSPTFTFTPQAGLCDPATIQRRATFRHPAGCIVAQQTYPPGLNFNIYKYTLQTDTPPGVPDPSGTYSQRVGSCGPC
jgi:hypothetical protein